MMGGRDERDFRIDLDRVVSDSAYRREILRRLAVGARPPRYRPGPQRSVDAPPAQSERLRTERGAGGRAKDARADQAPPAASGNAIHPND